MIDVPEETACLEDAKNLVVCSDGTGNSVMKGRGTNVFKLYEAVDTYSHRSTKGGRAQLPFYDDGVGTEKLKLIRVFGGAFGFGLSRNVRQLYKELCRSYTPGDRLYLFGFSRGAFTVRSLAGLIGDCGIIRREEWTNDRELSALVAKAYRAHRAQYRALVPTLRCKLTGMPVGSEAAKKFCKDRSSKARVNFLGVWDTVDAVGFPIVGVARAWNMVFGYKFPDTKLGDYVDQACQALSIDDERRTFKPEIWEDHPRAEQVWFAGMHSNVGGGYPRQGMSLETLDWMMTRAEAAGLCFSDALREEYASRRSVYDKMYDSRSGLGIYYRYQPRPIAEYCREKGVSPKIHESVFRRIAAGTDSYAPSTLPGDFEVVGTSSNPGPSEQGRYQSLASELIKSVKLEPLRESVKSWVWLRKALQFLFYFLSGSALIWALCDDALELPGSPKSQLGRLGYWVVDWLQDVANLWSAFVERYLSAPFRLSGLDEWLSANLSGKLAFAVDLVAGLPVPGAMWLSQNLVAPLVEQPEMLAAFLGSFVVCYYGGLLARMKTQGAHSTMWEELRKTIPSMRSLR